MIASSPDTFSGTGYERCSTFEDFKSEVARVRDHWEWLKEADHPSATNVASQFRSGINAALQQINQAQSSGRDFKVWLGRVQGYFYNHRLIHPSTDLARRIEGVRQDLGLNAGVLAYGLVAGWVNITDHGTLDNFQVLLALTMPGSVDLSKLAERMTMERQNFRQGLARVERTLTEAEEVRAAEWARRSETWDASALEVGKRAGRNFRAGARRFILWRRGQTTLLEDRRASIQAVEAAFREQMGLKAPVEYWEGKAKRHGKAEGTSRWLLIAYFIAAVGGMAGIFAATANFVTDPNRTIDTPVYFVLSAGLAAITGMIIWVGRLLTRLYLSEHHLRKDAEERATMTTTYLALTENGAASDADRQIILTALFRNTTDGIVRDDAAPDVGLSSLITRGLTPR